MRVFVFVLAGLVVLVLAIVVTGYALPVKHTASRERAYPVPANKVFAVITTPAEFPVWRSGVKRVEPLPDDAGRRSFREVSGDGTITFVVDESVPDRRLVMRIADKSLPFGGRWIYELTATAGGTQLRITEEGEVYNPVFRFVSRFVFGHHRSIETYLSDLNKRLAVPS